MRTPRAAALAAIAALLCAVLALRLWLEDGDGNRADRAALAPEPASDLPNVPGAFDGGSGTPRAEVDRAANAGRPAEAGGAAPVADRIEGRIVDERGVPVPRAYLGLFTMPGWQQQFIVRADRDGRVALDVPRGLAGTPWIGAAFPAHQNQAHPLGEFLGKQSDRARFVLLLPRGETLRGRVVDEHRRPIEGVLVRLDLASVEPTATDAAGGFTFAAGLPRGDHGLNLSARGYLGTHVAIAVPVKDGDPELVLLAQRAIRGRVHDEVGRGLSGIAIGGTGKAAGSRTTSDEHGAFELLESARGDDQIALEVAPGPTEGWRSEGLLAWGSEGVSIALRRALPFEVLVVDSRTRAPIERYALRAFRPGEPEAAATHQAHGPHAEGRAQIGPLLRGEWLFRVTAEESAYARSELVRALVADDVALETIVALERSASLRVRVEDPEGRPIGGARVELAFSAWREPVVLRPLESSEKEPFPVAATTLATTDREGRAELLYPPLHAPAAVCAAHAEFARGHRAGPFETGAEARVVLERGGRAEFRFVPPREASEVFEAWLAPIPLGPTRAVAPLRKTHAFAAFAELPSGEYQLFVRVDGKLFSVSDDRFRVRAGELHEQVVRLAPRPAPPAASSKAGHR